MTDTLCVCAGGVPVGACACVFSNTMLVLPLATAWNVHTSRPPAPTTVLELAAGAMNVLVPFCVTTLLSGAWVIDQVYPVVGLDARLTWESLPAVA